MFAEGCDMKVVAYSNKWHKKVRLDLYCILRRGDGRKLEAKPFNTAVIVSFHDRNLMLRGFKRYFMRVRASRSLSSFLAMIRFGGADIVSRSFPLSDCSENRLKPCTAPLASFSQSKKVFAEPLPQRSACLVSVAPVRTRGNIAASSTGQTIYQRCSSAA